MLEMSIDEYVSGRNAHGGGRGEQPRLKSVQDVPNRV